MTQQYSENRAHQMNIQAAEHARQVADAGATPAQRVANAVAYHNAVIASAIANGCSPSQNITALQELKGQAAA